MIRVTAGREKESDEIFPFMIARFKALSGII
jgi:hypothetical protein